MNPKRIKPYVEAESIRLEKMDKYMWMMGMYVMRATLVSVDAVLNGQKASTKYMEEPMLQTSKREEQERIDAEIQRQKVEALFMALDVWGKNHRLAQQEKEAKVK